MKKKRKKRCLACGKRYGRRSQRRGATFCSNLCRDSHEIEKALMKPDYKLHERRLNMKFEANMQDTMDAVTKVRTALRKMVAS